METLEFKICNLYNRELERKEKEYNQNYYVSGEKFYLLAGYELTIGLYYSLRKREKNVSFDSILNLYRMETIELYQYICANEKGISELKSIKILSLKTLRKVQDENLIILKRSEYI
ncbi:hypothetical protein CKN63_13245 [Carnobacterium divergens]|uniref:hypothetical protein n=1 Tax=Carnobacterium divergens TaxID=2748 RepID=UPI001071F924|nr:hypothetical protein [Carnobacterium divergens]TFI60526.1 hypothetical protein CKN59_13180 [Carnobacterium divergens]TFI61674.1 hypothetical protein CKN76_12805 [Carnobacterium divergens]TFJ01001.1 hypothetical protein CKN75_12770 [Carnobacterium divergens]TFJ08921.1 hypothetical protein CKN71_12785 [Carnobacterium divergens]TFJ15630.1 hypothetical protein CKN63_13245 [Carnobacterium divergens]